MLDEHGGRGTKGRAQSVLDFVSHLQRSLEPKSQISAALPDPADYLKAFPLPQTEISPARMALDRKGTQLWNLCRKLGLSRSDLEQSRFAQRRRLNLMLKIVLKITVRAFAFFMIDSAQERKGKAPLGKRWSLIAHIASG